MAKSADCSQGFCSVYCPQWCFIVQPSPPVFSPQESLPSTPFSPLFISIISILALSLLLLFYSVFSRSCSSSENLSPPRRAASLPVDWWYSPSDGGIEEAQIESIKAFKFSRGEERETSDCSICLGEFQEEETLRLLPRCHHAFHISCIDVWLRSNSRCPLCRRGVFSEGDEVKEEEEAEEEERGEGRSYGFRVIGRSLSVVEASRVDVEGGRMMRVYPAAGESSCGGETAAPPVKRSFSCGRFGLARHGRWSSSVLPY